MTEKIMTFVEYAATLSPQDAANFWKSLDGPTDGAKLAKKLNDDDWCWLRLKWELDPVLFPCGSDDEKKALACLFAEQLKWELEELNEKCMTSH